MSCIKTGAYVNFVDYGQYVAADIFEVADTFVIRFIPDDTNGDFGSFGPMRAVSHHVYLNRSGDNIFWRKDLGIAVVPKDAVVEAG